MHRRLRKLPILILLLVMAALSASAQNAAASLNPTKQPARRFVMWKVTSPTATVYLVGSMHLLAKDAYPLPKPVEDAFAASKVLAVEIDVKHSDPQKMQALVQQFGLYSSEDTLSKHLSKETLAALDEFCAKYGIPRPGLEPMKPWLVDLMASVIPMQKAGFDPTAGIDMHFLSEVNESQRITELETAEFQLGLLAGGTDQQQDAVLLYTLKNGESESRKIEESYLAGDMDAVDKQMADSPFPEYTKATLYDRNPQMASKVEAYLKGTDTCFVVVGAAHVIGDKGIANILTNKKYKVERMTLDW